ncbi:MAG: hypothetical protein GY804_05810 [Alphaproteobacteria bacterium]|nr:hypothetical protein [Alphaproteobacteria bacterium]
MNIEIVQFSKTDVACVRHTGPYEECKPAWDELCKWAGAKGLFGPDTTFLGICHDNPEITEPSKIRYDACISVNSVITPEKGIDVKTIESGKYVKAVHIGACKDIKNTYMHVCMEWIPNNGLEIRPNPCVEIYKSDYETTPEDEMITEIYVPVK